MTENSSALDWLLEENQPMCDEKLGNDGFLVTSSILMDEPTGALVDTVQFRFRSAT
jgi:hypothetical protein